MTADTLCRDENPGWMDDGDSATTRRLVLPSFGVFATVSLRFEGSFANIYFFHIFLSASAADPPAAAAAAGGHQPPVEAGPERETANRQSKL